VTPRDLGRAQAPSRWVELVNLSGETAACSRKIDFSVFFFQCKYFTSEEITQINYCRLYLQAITLSDLTKAGGKRLDPHMLKGRQSMTSSVTRLHHTNQSLPHEKAWTLWYRANRLWGDKNQRLKQPLGRCLVGPHKLRREWHSYVDTRNNELFFKSNSRNTRQNVAIKTFKCFGETVSQSEGAARPSFGLNDIRTYIH
jgi:hypothetical protein